MRDYVVKNNRHFSTDAAFNDLQAKWTHCEHAHSFGNAFLPDLRNLPVNVTKHLWSILVSIKLRNITAMFNDIESFIKIIYQN